MSMLAGCGEGSVHHPADSQKVPKLRQSRPESRSTQQPSPPPPQPWVVRSREVQGGYRQLVSRRRPPPPSPPNRTPSSPLAGCSLVQRRAGLSPTYTQKGQCALNAGASPLTSEPYSKCHLAPERQHQQWLLSSKEHLRPGATVKPMITFSCKAILYGDESARLKKNKKKLKKTLNIDR